MAGKKYQIVLFQEFNWWVAQCLEVDVATQGGSRDEALENIAEALRLLQPQGAEDGGPSLFPPPTDALPTADLEKLQIEI